MAAEKIQEAQKPRSISRRVKLDWPEHGPAVALAFSGGGMRASLAGMGMARAIADAGLLSNLRYSSSVSGGSWPNAILAKNWAAIAAASYTTDAVDELVLQPFFEQVTTKSVSAAMMRNIWKIVGKKTRTDLLADVFDDWFGDGITLGELDQSCRWLFNATNLQNGARWEFDIERVGDHKAKYIRGDTMRLADALGASASLPGAMATQRLRSPFNVYPSDAKPKLVDGAVYDNLGIEPLLQIRDKPLIVVLDAGAPLKKSVRDTLGLVGTLRKSQAVISRQTTTLRKRWFIDQLRTWEDWEASDPEGYDDFLTDQAAKQEAVKDWVKGVRKGLIDAQRDPRPSMPPKNAKRGVIFGLGTTMDNAGDITNRISKHQRYVADPDVPEVPAWREGMTPNDFRTSVAEMPMSAGKVDELFADDLIYRGWWLTRETIRTFHPEVLPEAGFPNWKPYR